jgi:hypothetical protein
LSRVESSWAYPGKGRAILVRSAVVLASILSGDDIVATALLIPERKGASLA